MPTAMSTIVARTAHSSTTQPRMRGFSARWAPTRPASGEVVEAIPREGRFRHPTMLPVRRAGAAAPASPSGVSGRRPRRACDPRVLARVAEAAQPLDEHRVVLLRVGRCRSGGRAAGSSAPATARDRRGSPPPSRPRDAATPPRSRGWRGRGRSGARAHANARRDAARRRATPRTPPSGSTAASGTPSRPRTKPPHVAGIDGRIATRRAGPGGSIVTHTASQRPQRRDEPLAAGARDVRQDARRRDRRASRRRGARAASRRSTAGSVASPSTMSGGSAATMSSAASMRARAPVLPRPHQGREEPPVRGIRGVERSEVDARPPDDLRHPQRRVAAEPQSHSSTTVGGAVGRVEVGARRRIAVRVAVGVQAQPRARADLEQRDRARRCRSAREAAPRTAAARWSAGCGAAHSATTSSACAASHAAHAANGRLGRPEQPRDREHERRLPMRRRDAARGSPADRARRPRPPPPTPRRARTAPAPRRAANRA